MVDKKLDLLAQAKNIFEDLKADDSSVLFTEDKINGRLFKKLKKSSHIKNKELVDLIKTLKISKP